MDAGKRVGRTLIFLLAFVWIGSFAVPGHAQVAVGELQPLGEAGHFGAGIGGGTLTSGVTAKYYVGDRHALQAFVGLWRFGFLSPALSLDYVQELGPLIDIEAGHLVWGIGGGVGGIFDLEGLEDIWHFGISAVTGPVWQFNYIPVELTIDVRPTLIFGEVFGGVRIGVGGALRWYFL
ncbi:MAG: hypothetical protein ACNA8W_02660 [Bradymonadaceae bacterium]